MKIIGQRVAQATVEVNGYVERRIGTGLLLMLGLREGTSEEDVRSAANKVSKIKLWSQQQLGTGGEGMMQTFSNVVDGGYEVLVILQQSLCATFPGPVPSEKEAMQDAEAELLFQEFVKRLRQLYQEEMVVPVTLKEARICATSDGGVFDLSSLARHTSHSAGSPGLPMSKPMQPKTAAHNAPKKPPPLKSEVGCITRALRQMKDMSRSKRDLASIQLFEIMGLPDFLESLSEADQAAADGFAEALDQAAECFTAQQQEQITAWTGLPISAAKSAQAQEQEEPVQEEVQEQLEEEPDVQDDDGSALEKQLAQLREEANAALASTRVKTEAETHDVFSRKQAGGTGQPRATSWQRPEEPQETQTLPGAQIPPPKGSGKKGNGCGRRSIGGIISLDASARLHGMASWQDFESGQLNRFKESRTQISSLRGEGQVDGAKRTAPYSQWTSRKLMKGTPTLAPMTPAKSEDDFNDI